MSSQSGAFESAVVNISWASNAAYSISLVYAGSGYTNGVNTFRLLGTLFDGLVPLNNATVTVTNAFGVLSSPTVTGTGPARAGNINVNLEYNTQYIMRDASDVTRALKERIMYNEKRTGSPINTGKRSLIVGGRPQVNPAGVNHLPAGNAQILWQPQGNEFRLSYLMGKLKCGGCVGGAFNQNGPLSGS
jgi:hypothetical protein